MNIGSTSNFPSEIVTKLEDYKQPVVPWNMKPSSEAIYQYVIVQEKMYSIMFHVKGQQFMSQQVMGSHKQPLRLQDTAAFQSVRKWEVRS